MGKGSLEKSASQRIRNRRWRAAPWGDFSVFLLGWLWEVLGFDFSWHSYRNCQDRN